MIPKGWDISEHATGRFKDGKPIIGATFQNGLNDKNADGTYSPCDIRISKVTQGVTHLRMNRGRMGELRFGDSSHPNSFLVKIKNKALKGVSFKYTGAGGSSMTANNGKPLCHFDNGISIESTPYYKGVKMDIIVNDPLTAPIEYPFSVKDYGQKYTFIEDENGGATLRGEDQDPIFIKPPYAVDANGDIGLVTVHYTGIVNNLITFKKVVDEEWLRHAAAPVRIDPDVTIDDDSGTFEDTYLNKQSPTTNNGSAGFFTLRRISFTNQRNILLGVDLSAYSDVTVTAARFGLNIYTGAFPVTNINWYETNPSWVELQATWNKYNTGNNWDTAGCLGSGTDHAITAENDGSPKTVSEIASDEHFDMTNETVQGRLGSFLRIVIYQTTQQSTSFFHVRSSEAVLGNKPYFYMEFTEEAAFQVAWARNSNQIIGASQ